MGGQAENVAALTRVLSFYQKKNRSNDAKLFLIDLVKRNPKHAAAQTTLAALERAKKPDATPVP